MIWSREWRRRCACRSLLDEIRKIDISKKIDTYDISILPYEDCCTIFLPKHPVINPKLDKAKEEEAKFDYNSLIEKTINNIEHIKINSKEKNFDI